MTSLRECVRCGGSGRYSFEPCRECKGLGMIEDEEPNDAFEEEPDEEWRNMYEPWFL